MKLKATTFRQNLYKYLDLVLEKNEVLEIDRKDETILIMKKQKRDIYAIMDERESQVTESESQYGLNNFSALENDWEEKWDQQWDEWLKK